MVRKMIQVGAVPDGEDDNLEGYAAGDCDDDALNTGLELHCYTKHGRHTAATRATTDDGGDDDDGFAAAAASISVSQRPVQTFNPLSPPSMIIFSVVSIRSLLLALKFVDVLILPILLLIVIIIQQTP